MIPTFLDVFDGLEDLEHVLEGKSLRPALHGVQKEKLRDAVFAEIDYAFKPARIYAELEPSDARGFMVRTERWKYMLWEGYPSQLFDLEADPDEFNDLGGSPDHSEICAELHERLFHWLRSRATRITMSDQTVRNRTGSAPKRGILIGRWLPDEVVKDDPDSDYWVK